MKKAPFSSAFSIRKMLITSFIILMLITVSVIGVVMFSQWWSSTEAMVTRMETDLTHDIQSQIDVFLSVPLSVNAANHGLFQAGVVDMADAAVREPFFVSILKAQPDDVYSFSYGSESGAYFGARRNADNVVEIMRNSPETGGHSWYYSVAPDMTAGEKVLDAGLFDARSRAWYQAAKTAGRPVFSAIYKHFVMDDLTLSAAYPVYDEAGGLQGVLGTHIILSRLSQTLKTLVEDEQAMAWLVEPESGALVASSDGITPFVRLADQSIERLTVAAIDHEAVKQAFQDYRTQNIAQATLETREDAWYIRLTPYTSYGLDWLVVTAIPTRQLTSGIITHMQLAAWMTLLALLILVAVYMRLTNRLMKPIDTLVDAAGRFSAGDLSVRAHAPLDNEIGRLSMAFNKMADASEHLIHHLDDEVKERTAELQAINLELKENKDQLQLLLDSTAEAIYGMDLQGICTFCNASCLKILGYEHADQLLGKNMHEQIHHSHRDGRAMPINDCRIYQSIHLGKGNRADDEVFWRADGSRLDVEYYSYPQFKDGEVIGAVITFMDISERKKAQEEIQYLSFHDSLTGLYNRGFFETEMKRLDTGRNLPISIIVCDVNNLKLTNDVFGHSAGDKLLQRVADIFRRVCRNDDIIARTGGDEFVILLPRTSADDAFELQSRIRKTFLDEQVEAINVSISMGTETKSALDQSLDHVMENAEDRMYQDKTLNRKTTQANSVNGMLAALHARHPWEKDHAQRVSELSRRVGHAMALSESDIRKLAKAGLLHDIGKAAVDDGILDKQDLLNDEENRAVRQHPAVGYRILYAFEETMDLAEIVLTHHELWDGSGYPRGARMKEIPLLARVIAVTEAFDMMTTWRFPSILTRAAALDQIEAKSGIWYDPAVVAAFLSIMRQ